jgi:Outer membrane lipoprotein Slp family
MIRSHVFFCKNCNQICSTVVLGSVTSEDLKMKAEVIAGCLLLSTLFGCSTVPSSVSGNFVAVTQTQAASSPAFVGTEVRWGGVVVGTRQSDAGECLEVAAYPLDTYSARPYRGEQGPQSFATLFGKDVANHDSTGGFHKDRLPPRFLACDEPRGDAAVNHVGAVLTLTGILEPARSFHVSNDACTTGAADTGWHRNERTPDYVGTTHAVGNTQCDVSLPTVRIHSSYAWKEPPETSAFH